MRSRSTFPSLAVALAIGTVVSLTPFLSSAETPSPTPPNPASLKGKTDQELLDIVIGPRNAADSSGCETDSERKTSPLDRLWEMDPRDAAVAFATDYLDDVVKGMVLKIDDRNAKPPASGEVGLRWISGNEYATPEHGLTVLKYDGYDSELLVSQVLLTGQASKEQIEAAVMKTDRHPLRRLVAQQTFEILWWLRHVTVEGPGPQASTSGSLSSADDYGRFWMKPDGPVIEKAYFRQPCGSCLAERDADSYEGFADTLIRRLIYRSGIKDRYPKPAIGTHVDPDEDAKFLHEAPPRENAEALKQWITRSTSILRNPKRQYLYSQLMEALVPIADPLRYDDSRIDDALLDVLHRGLDAAATVKRLEAEENERAKADAERDFDGLDLSKSEDLAKLEEREKASRAKREPIRDEIRSLRNLQFNAAEAMAKLGFHDATKAFDELFQLTRRQPSAIWSVEGPLVPVAAIAGRHPELRPELAKYLGEMLSRSEEQTARGTPTIEAIWRADLRELTPRLEEIAALSRPAGNPHDVRETTIEKASLVLMTWRETDALTRAKLNALLTGKLSSGGVIPETLRKGFAELAPEDKFAFRQFIIWLRSVDAGFSRRYLENTFTPHTPRPDIQFEL